LLFALTRSLLAALLFDNMMALVGFVVKDLSLPGSVAHGRFSGPGGAILNGS
jgi:hypothetical protein